jgi:hypothetical protein
MSLYSDMIHDGADHDELGERLANELQAERQRSNKAERQLDACMAQAREVKKGRDELRSIIAACRDAMPDIPGHEEWPQWAEAVSDPGSVPGYVRRCVGELTARLAAAERERDRALAIADNKKQLVQKCDAAELERDAAQARVSELEAEAARLLEALSGVLPMAEALHSRNYDITCDHDEYCHCDAEARSSEALRVARAALAGDGGGMRRELTQYGFAWGPVEVERTVSDPQFGVVLCIKTKRERQYIRVTPTGFIRIEERTKEADHDGE